MDKLTFKEWSILADLETIAPLGEDFEFSMARGELKTAQDAITRLMGKLKGEGDLEAWVQSKITKAAEYLDTVADHLTHGEDDTKRKSDLKNESLSPHEEATQRSKEKLNKEKKITTAPMVMPKNAVYRPKEDPIKDTSAKEPPKPKEEEKKEPLTALQAAKLRKLEREKKKKKKKLREDWSQKYKKSIDCDNPKGFSQKAHCQGRKKNVDEEVSDLAEKCWKGYVKKGMKTMFGKRYPNCVKKEEVEIEEDKDPCWDSHKQVGMKKKGGRMVPNCVPKEEVEIEEANKSGDSSLRDWFTKSRSSDGTPGWVQLGGKYAGKPCARQPGQTTKPKCGSSKMKADLSDEEEASAFRRKNQEDPNPNRKGKAKNVATEEASIEEGTKDACYHKVKSRYSVWPSAYASGALVKCRKVGAANWGNKTKKEDYEFSNWRDDFTLTEYEFIDIIKPDPIVTSTSKKKLHEIVHDSIRRYCPGCKKIETMAECKLGPNYWRLNSIPAALTPDNFDPNEIHPTNEDYQRIQSTGNVYTILFSWRGRSMMNLQLFFPSMKRPSKDEVQKEIEKFYPGAIIMQWYPSPSDPSKPIVVIQSK